MNVDLELYRVFYVVAKNKHMTKASEKLHTADVVRNLICIIS